MGRVRWSVVGVVFVAVVFTLAVLRGDAREGLGFGGGHFVPVQCDPNTDPECNLPPPSGGGGEGQPPPATPPATVVPSGNTATEGDRDRDGVLDATDACPDTFGRKPNGCPLGEDLPTEGYGEFSGTASALLQPVVETPVVSLATLQAQCLVINEVLWAGTGFSKEHQYIELRNGCDQSVILEGLQLRVVDKQTDPLSVTGRVALQGAIDAQGYYLVVNNRFTLSGVEADLVAKFALRSTNTAIVLTDDLGATLSTANLPANATWFAGGASRTQTFSMERDERTLDAPDEAASWHANDGTTRNGLDALGDPINGTPRAPNSPAPQK